MRGTHRSMAILGVLLVLGLVSSSGAEAAEGTPTFTKDVAPILFEHCAACRRPNHLAPMSLMSYNDARPWARAVKTKVLAREMPPWGAESGFREYKNDASLSQAESTRSWHGSTAGRRRGTTPTCPSRRRSPTAGRSASPT